MDDHAHVVPDDTVRLMPDDTVRPARAGDVPAVRP
jgi:hypothetical protein